MKDLKRYIGRLRLRDATVFGSHEDWFTDDDDARATYRVIMEEQGYKVKNVSVNDQIAIIDIE
jgi:hypothetical protein